MATAGRLMVEIGANIARLNSDMRRATGIIENTTRSMNRMFKAVAGAAAAAFSVSAIKSFGEQAVKNFAEIERSSFRLGKQIELIDRKSTRLNSSH
jgi:hypothetical protein